LSTAAQLEQIANDYNARAAEEYRPVGLGAEAAHGDDVDPTLLTIRDAIDDYQEDMALWSFKVPVSVWVHFKCYFYF
jgi:hypothetical protein